MEVALDLSTSMSNRRCADVLNRVRLQGENGINVTTLRNTIEREGQKMQAYIETRSEELLSQNGFNDNGELQEGMKFIPDEATYIDAEDVKNAAAELNIKIYNPADYEADAVNISIDDVCVKRQTETRPRDEEAEQAKRVNNTVINVQHSSGSYILNNHSIFGALKWLIAFLISSSLLGKQLVIFADGARDINNAVLKMLGFTNFKIILDWYHLEKKCKEQLSMALKGSKIRNEFLERLLPCLWFGNVSRAIILLENIDPKNVRDHSVIIKLIEYFERIRRYIPCYALRKRLGLRNSSNLGEKSNDLVVSDRQKHNGMSWSDDGSVAFATVTTVFRNGELPRWVKNHDLAFVPISRIA